MNRAERQQSKAFARTRVVEDIERQVRLRADLTVPGGKSSDPYTREVARLWRVALRAVKAEGRP